MYGIYTYIWMIIAANVGNLFHTWSIWDGMQFLGIAWIIYGLSMDSIWITYGYYLHGIYGQTHDIILCPFFVGYNPISKPSTFHFDSLVKKS